MTGEAGEPDDDMHDPKDRAAPLPLGEFLRICDPCAESPAARPCFRAEFVEADARANRARRAYARVVRIAALMGVGALLLGLAQRLFGSHESGASPGGSFLLALEFAYTLAALLVALAALLMGRQERWLSERFRAERLRLLKFRLLIDPKLWRPGLRDLAPWRNRLETEQRVIANQPDGILDALKATDSLAQLPATEDCLAVDPSALMRLLEYYRRKRLGSQLEYFEERMRKKMRHANPRLPGIFFFAGIALVLCNDILEWATRGTRIGRVETASMALVLASLAVPMGWSAIRIVRGAHEFSRNASRSHARHAALSEIAHHLDEATASSPDRWDRPAIFGYLSLCEGVLAADQHEWMRLMKDAEWHG